jgi:plasmid maintenance system antidote protein VapI
MLDQEVDDKGTDQAQAKEIIRNLRDRAFDADDDQLAVALGRTVEQVQTILNGTEPVDDDLVMKARGIALHRGVEVE